MRVRTEIQWFTTCCAADTFCLGTVRGEGAASTLKFSSEVNVQGWWRMLGPDTTSKGRCKQGQMDGCESVVGSAHNITITDLHLHGNTNHTKYPCHVPGACSPPRERAKQTPFAPQFARVLHRSAPGHAIAAVGARRNSLPAHVRRRRGLIFARNDVLLAGPNGKPAQVCEHRSGFQSNIGARA